MLLLTKVQSNGKIRFGTLMKMTNIFGCALALMIGVTATVAKDEQTATLKAAFNKVPAVDVPAKAADIVAQAKDSERDMTAMNVVKVALQKSPTIAPAIVGAIAKQSPETAPVVAATAATLQPKQVKLIAQAAAAAAPQKAGEIAEAVAKALPAEYRDIALSVSQGAPKSTKEILAGVSAAVPGIRAPIDQAISTLGGKATVAAVMDRVSPVTTTPVATVTPIVAPVPTRGPSPGPPYVPFSGSPNNVPPNGGTVPTGGRTYAAP